MSRPRPRRCRCCWRVNRIRRHFNISCHVHYQRSRGGKHRGLDSLAGYGSTLGGASMEDSSCARTSSRDTTRHALAHEEFARYFHGSAVRAAVGSVRCGSDANARRGPDREPGFRERLRARGGGRWRARRSPVRRGRERCHTFVAGRTEGPYCSRGVARTNDLEDRVAAVVAIATLLWYPPALDPIAEHFLAAHGATF